METFVDAVRLMGSDAKDVRDAAHEACHALEFGAAYWGRESIHRSLKEVCATNAELVGAEVRARAVEGYVCRSSGIDYDLDEWVFAAVRETLKREGISVPFLQYKNMIYLLSKSRSTAAMARRIISLHRPELNVDQSRVLSHLCSSQGPKRIAKLVREMIRERSWVASKVKSLHSKGLVVKNPDRSYTVTRLGREVSRCAA